MLPRRIPLRLWLGLWRTGLGLWALGAVACDDGPPCGGHCGPGTTCENNLCVVADPSEPEADPVVDAKTPSKRRRRGRRGSKGDGGTPGEPGFSPVDDSDVAQYDPNATRTLDMKGGSERLSDRVVNRELRSLEPRFNDCIKTAATHSDEDIAPGEVTFVLQIQPTGKVSGVTVKAPKHLRVFGIVPCLRKAVASHRFPAYDGPPMGVDYAFGVG